VILGAAGQEKQTRPNVTNQTYGFKIEFRVTPQILDAQLTYQVLVLSRDQETQFSDELLQALPVAAWPS
jgi:hypothetical protein